MSNQNVLFNRPEPGVALLTLNRPNKHNAFNPELIRELSRHLDACEKDDSINIVILAANGKNFSAGADIVWMQKMIDATEQENIDDALELANLMKKIYQLPKPVIAKVSGAVMGGAVGLVACCDIAIASKNSFFCFSEVKIGLIPAVISPYIIRAIGERATRRYFLTAERITAEKALQLNLVHECLENYEIEEYISNLTKQMQQNCHKAIAQSKQLIQDISHLPIEDGTLNITAKKIAEIRVSEEAQQKLNAFINKSKA